MVLNRVNSVLTPMGTITAQQNKPVLISTIVLYRPGKVCRYPDSKVWGQHGVHLGPIDPRWSPCWPHEPCYQGIFETSDVSLAPEKSSSLSGHTMADTCYLWLALFKLCILLQDPVSISHMTSYCDISVRSLETTIFLERDR